MVRSLLPEGCPFVVGGGFVRDIILGGRPSDIDVWLPSNLRRCELADEFVQYMLEDNMVPSAIVFRGPGSRTEGENLHGASGAHASQAYLDINNHWVAEVPANSSGGIGGYDNAPAINFMRTMVTWDGDAQAFFTGLMRSFDIDTCMFFMGWDQTENIQNIRHAIMPQHLWNLWRHRIGGNRQDLRQLRINEIHFNELRANAASATRLAARIDKMCLKYHFSRPRSIEEVQRIPVDQIVALPVDLTALRRMTSRWDSSIPGPTFNNTLTRQAFDNLPNNRISGIMQNL